MYESARIYQLQIGNPEAWRDLIDKTRTRLIGTAYLILKDESEAEDVVQTIFTRLWEQRERFRTIQHFECYIFRAVRNQALNVIRKRQRLVSMAVDHIEAQNSVISNRDQPASIAERNELSARIKASRQLLSQRQQEVLSVLQNDPDQSSRQIAAVIGCSHKNVLALIGRIRNAFQESDDITSVFLIQS